MSSKVIKFSIFIVIVFILIGSSCINTACGLINQTLENRPSGSLDKDIESEINKKITDLGLSENIEFYLLKAFQDKPGLFDNIYSEYSLWEWLKSNQSATSGDIDNAIEIVAKDKFYCTSFIDSLLELNEKELLELLADDTLLEKKYKDYLENLTESFFENGILFYIDKQTYLSYFPEETRTTVYLPEEIQDKVKNVIITATEAYPLGFVPQYLKKLYIIDNKIKTEKVNDATAITFGEIIFITDGDKNNEILYLPVFHHVFNHLLQNKHKELFDSYYEDWISDNPEGFEYYGYEPYLSDEDKLEMYKDGFITPLSMVNYGCDFAEIASYAFSKDPLFLNLIMDYPLIMKKFELMVDFYNNINPGITLGYFER